MSSKKISREQALRKIACAYAMDKTRQIIRGPDYLEAHIEHDSGTMTIIVSYHSSTVATTQTLLGRKK